MALRTSCSTISSALTTASGPPAAIASPSRRPIPTADAPRHSALKPPKELSKFATDIDPRIAEVIMKGLQPNPAERWQTMSEMLIPLRRAHEEIEAKKQLERKLKAAAAKAKAAKTHQKTADEVAKIQKSKEDDAFVAQILLGEATKKSGKSKTKRNSSTSPSQNRDGSASKTQNSASNKPSELDSEIESSNDAQPDIVIEEEFDGFEIEEEGHKSDEIDDESSDEFDGIEIEVEGELPVAAETFRIKPDKPVADDDDEPVLRLPDDD